MFFIFIFYIYIFYFLDPAASIHSVSTMKECELDGYILPSDANIFVMTLQLLRDPKYWNDSHSFVPQRFWDKNYKEKELPEGVTREMVFFFFFYYLKLIFFFK